MTNEPMIGNERRLGDRVLYALELGLEQKDLEVCELLIKALETVLTRFGGPGAIEKRDLPERMIEAFDAYDRLRRGQHEA